MWSIYGYRNNLIEFQLRMVVTAENMVIWVPVVVASRPKSTVAGLEVLLFLLGGSAEGW